MFRLFTILAFLSVILAFGQDPASSPVSSTEDHKTAHDPHGHFQAHRLAIVTGYGFLSGAINQEGEKRPHVVPVFGVDYEYWFNHRIGIGTHNDLELGQYSVEQIFQKPLKEVGV